LIQQTANKIIEIQAGVPEISPVTMPVIFTAKSTARRR